MVLRQPRVYFQVGRIQDAAVIACFLLITLQISLLYNDMGLEKFQVCYALSEICSLLLTPYFWQDRANAIGAASLAFFHMIPNLCVFAIVAQEIIRSSSSVTAGVLCALTACLPGVYHFARGVARCVWSRRRDGKEPMDDVEMGEACESSSEACKTP